MIGEGVPLCLMYAVLGIEVRVSFMLDSHSLPTKPHPSFCFYFFLIITNTDIRDSFENRIKASNLQCVVGIHILTNSVCNFRSTVDIVTALPRLSGCAVLNLCCKMSPAEGARSGNLSLVQIKRPSG